MHERNLSQFFKLAKLWQTYGSGAVWAGRGKL